MRNAIIAVLAITIGAAAGAWIMRLQMDGQLTAALAEQENLRKQLEEVRADSMLPAEREKALMSEIEALQARLNSLETQQKAQRSAGVSFEASPNPETNVGDAAGQPPSPDAAMADGERRRGPRERDENVSEEERQQRAERWREFQQQFRDRMDSFFQEQYNAAPDAASKERIAQLQQYAEYMMQLRESMRNATTEEERESLRQAMRDTGANMAELARQQRDQMMRQLAQQFGIQDPSQQESFISQLQSLESNPLYLGAGMLGPRGFGGPPGGPRGGGPGGEGGPRR